MKTNTNEPALKLFQGTERCFIKPRPLQVGALTILYQGVNDPYNGDLTFVGHVLEGLPMDVRLGRLIILGHVFGCLDDCIIIAAALSTRPLLINSFMHPIKSYK